MNAIASDLVIVTHRVDDLIKAKTHLFNTGTQASEKEREHLLSIQEPVAM